jgi:hypothetical protein
VPPVLLGASRKGRRGQDEGDQVVAAGARSESDQRLTQKAIDFDAT